MTVSSINFQKVRGDQKQALEHIARTTKKEPEYLLDNSVRKPNDFELLVDPKILHEQQIALRRKNHSRGKAPSLDDNLWEAVINLEEQHSIADVKRVAEHIRQKYKLTPYAVAIHRDEGHKTSNGEIKYNYHAHVMFYTVSNGLAQMRTVGKKGLSSMQSEVAELLHMQRGQVNSKTVRLNHRQYRQAQKEKAQAQELFTTIAKSAIQTNEELKSELMTLKEQKAIVEAERKKYKEEADHIASEYRALQALNKTLHTREELDLELKKLRQEYEDRISKLKNKNTELNDTVNDLKNEITSLKQQLEIKPKEIVKTVEKTVTVKRELTDDEIENLPRVQSLNRTIKTLKENEQGLIAQKDYFDKAYNAELEIHQTLQQENKRLQAENTNLKDKLKTLSEFNRTVLDVFKAMHSDFDINHPIDSLKKIYLNWKSRSQKPSIMPLERSITNKNTIERVEVLPDTKNRAMSILEQNTTIDKKYEIVIGNNACLMTAQDIKQWLEDMPEDTELIVKQLSESDRREVFSETKKEQQHSPRVDHHFSR